MALELIAPTTAAVSTPAPYSVVSERIGSTITASGLAGAEEVTIMFSVDDGVTWEDLYIDDAPMILTATSKMKTIYGNALLGVVKSASAAAVGVYAFAPDSV